MKTNTSTPHERFCTLAAKYAVPVPRSWRLERPGGDGENEFDDWCIRDDSGKTVPLFPWRCERRFVELRRIVETNTLEDVVLCRFSRVGDAGTTTLRKILYREFDLLEWITGGKIVSVFGSSFEDRFSNVLARLDNGTIGSIEAGVTLPVGTETLDRHELIARRGVASDRVVDTHVPQQSVYLFEKDGVRCWTDTDAELFELDAGEIAAVRAAFELAKNPETAGDNIAQRERLVKRVAESIE